MYGVYNLERNTLVGYFVDEKNWRVFLEFLKMVRRHYRHSGVLHIVLDNASFHRKAEVVDYAAAHQIRFYWTPTSASWLNRIESHFTAVRKFALDNTDYQSHEEQEAAINTYLIWRNGGCNIRIQAWRSYKHRLKKAA